MLTTFDLDEYVYEALRAGASGFLLKDSPRGDLIAAVRAAAAGNAMLAPTVTRRLIEAFARRPPETSPAPSRLAALTAREREVLVLLARGGSNTEIAAALFVSEATVKTHVGNLLAKLGLRDRVQAVILAYETGVVAPATRRATADPCPTAPARTELAGRGARMLTPRLLAGRPRRAPPGRCARRCRVPRSGRW
jgi:DNA-binding NarL/FixJ family response regulator